MMIGRYDIYSLALAAGVISFLGFVLENIWLACRKGYMDNRNMTLPFLLGYGMLVDGIYLLIGTPEELHINAAPNASLTTRYIVYFLSAAVIVSVGEIALGTAVEKIFGFEYWNYESLPMHITKYTSIPTSLGFAFIITFFMGKCFTPIMSLVGTLEQHDLRTTAVVLTAAMVSDFVISFAKMYKTRSLNIRWTVHIPVIKDSVDKVKAALKG
ncbi:MAG: putative ABC transporter permease [Oscillospiraceae bacterium]|nr:putative ABC transporter permease [Oscillospiraceae bacterium]MDD7428814.1 putative ABC transporter permease [Oscillospiraceae bacterium]MDY2848268.1 putative ABC transporter permease [Oscillospiraceae bacterium]